MSCRIRHRIVISCVIASVLAPVAWADNTKDPTLIDQLVYLNTLIEERCGERLDVVWVDERGKNPPCLMSYSNSCSEIQSSGPQSCTAMMKTLVE